MSIEDQTPSVKSVTRSAKFLLIIVNPQKILIIVVKSASPHVSKSPLTVDPVDLFFILIVFVLSFLEHVLQRLRIHM